MPRKLRHDVDYRPMNALFTIKFLEQTFRVECKILNDEEESLSRIWLWDHPAGSGAWTIQRKAAFVDRRIVLTGPFNRMRIKDLPNRHSILQSALLGYSCSNRCRSTWLGMSRHDVANGQAAIALPTSEYDCPLIKDELKGRRLLRGATDS